MRKFFSGTIEPSTAQGIAMFMSYAMGAGAAAPWVDPASGVVLAAGLITAAASPGAFRRWDQAPRDTVLARVLLGVAIVWSQGLALLSCVMQLAYVFAGEQHPPPGLSAFVVGAGGLTVICLFTLLVPVATTPLLPAAPTVPQRVLAEEPTDVYRLYDRRGLLLYTGITADLSSRFTKHRRKKPWWPDVAEARVETYPDRWLALAVEQSSIAHERPVHNVSPGGLYDHGTRGTGRTYVHRRTILLTTGPQVEVAEGEVETVMLAEGVPREVAYRRVLQIRAAVEVSA